MLSYLLMGTFPGTLDHFQVEVNCLILLEKQETRQKNRQNPLRLKNMGITDTQVIQFKPGISAQL